MSILAVEQALIILKQVALCSGGIGVRDTARKLGYSPSVAQRSLEALVAQGFAVQDSISKQYKLGPSALEVGLITLSRLEIRQVARPHLETLRDITGETALLGVRHGDVSIYVDQVLSLSEVRTDVNVGSRRPLNCTAVGKVLLADMLDEEIDRLAREGAFVHVTHNSVTDLSQLRLELAEVREKGLARDFQEFLPGSMCFAAPVRNHEGSAVGAIAISGPAQRVEAGQDQIAQQVIDCALQTSEALGYQRSGLVAASHRTSG